jgi:hypothetical protein
MKFTVTSRIALIVAVAVGCAWWVGVAPASSVEGRKDDWGWGSTITQVTQRDYKNDYIAVCEGGAAIVTKDFSEAKDVKLCFARYPCPSKTDAIPIHETAEGFADCMTGLASFR